MTGRRTIIESGVELIALSTVIIITFGILLTFLPVINAINSATNSTATSAPSPFSFNYDLISQIILGIFASMGVATVTFIIAPFISNLIKRKKVTTSMLHEREAEFFSIIQIDMENLLNERYNNGG